MTRPLITAIRITPASTREKRRGLRAYASFIVDGAWRVDGVTVRLTAAGTLVLSYPSRLDRWGTEHPYVLPTDDAVRREVEAAVFAAMELEGVAP